MNPLEVSLEGQVAVITGGGGGIGRGIALTLAQAGANIVIAEIVPERAAEVGARVRALGRRALPVVMDMMDCEQISTLIAKADDEFGRIDILVNNAGGVSGRPFLEQSERSWRRHIDINFVSMLACTHAAAPIMIRGGRGGAIVNIASSEGSRAAPNFAVYAACKAGMISFTKTMALELSGHGIRVNCLAPDHTITPGMMGNRTGPVDEGQWRKRSPEEEDAFLRSIPLQRFGVVEECGRAALFLCSQASDYISGVTLPIDGGTSAASGWVRGRDGRWTLQEGLSFGSAR
ncbi:MAG: SDR family oxidoreductase [Alphaproteobacteria bacterium]|nr:SDR family oxidoreductase [Alphaproteobacteria bacterium]